VRANFPGHHPERSERPAPPAFVAVPQIAPIEMMEEEKPAEEGEENQSEEETVHGWFLGQRRRIED